MSNRSIWPIDKTLSGASIAIQSIPRSDGNEGKLYTPQRYIITGTSLSDSLVSYPEHSLEASYPSAEKQSIYSAAPADYTKKVTGVIWNRSKGCERPE